MRIAIVCEQATPLSPVQRELAGAPAWHATELAAALAAAGDEVRVYARRDAPDRPEVSSLPAGATQPAGTTLPAGATLRHVPAGPATPLSERGLLRHTRVFGERLAKGWADEGWTPDVIHAYYWLSGLAAVVASRVVPAPTVLTYQDLGARRRRHLGQADTSPAERVGFERELGRGADLVITHSRAETSELIELGLSRRQIAIVPLGVDPDRFAPAGPFAPLRQEQARIVMVGYGDGLIDRQGYGDAIRALRVVPDAALAVVGGPAEQDLAGDPQARELRAMADRLGVADRVRLVGRVPREEVPGWYHQADLATNAAWWDSFGITAVESMAAGVPVVATEVGGYADTVVDGLTGALVPPRHPRALGRAMREVLSDPIRRVEYAAAGLDRVRQVYSWDRVAARVRAEYQKLLRA